MNIDLNQLENKINLLNKEIAKLEYELKHKQNEIKMLVDIKPSIRLKEKRARQIEREREKTIKEMNKIPRRLHSLNFNGEYAQLKTK